MVKERKEEEAARQDYREEERGGGGEKVAAWLAAEDARKAALLLSLPSNGAIGLIQGVNPPVTSLGYYDLITKSYIPVPTIPYNGSCVSVVCLHTPTPQLSFVPDPTLIVPDYYLANSPETIGYGVYFNPRNIDWLHAGTNLVGIVGDAAVIVTVFGTPPPFVVDDALVIGLATGANAVGAH